MRKFNAVLGIFIAVLFFLHIIGGILLLTGVFPVNMTFMKICARVLVTAAAVHVFTGTKLTVDTLAAVRKSGVSYGSENRMFWIRRWSGFAVLLFIAAHVFEFMVRNGEVPATDTPGLICSVLLAVSVMLHVLTNIRPMMISLGIAAEKGAVTVPVLAVSVLLALSGAAFVIYYVRMLSM